LFRNPCAGQVMTILSYSQIMLRVGGGAVVLNGSNGVPFAPLRYVLWAHTCPSLIMLCRPVETAEDNRLTSSAVGMIIAGFAASLDLPLHLELAGLAVSFYFFAYCMRGLLQQVALVHQTAPRCRLLSMVYLVSWSLFPAIWLVVHAGWVSLETEFTLLGAADVLAKLLGSTVLVFYQLYYQLVTSRERLTWELSLAKRAQTNASRRRVTFAAQRSASSNETRTGETESDTSKEATALSESDAADEVDAVGDADAANGPSAVGEADAVDGPSTVGEADAADGARAVGEADAVAADGVSTAESVAPSTILSESEASAPSEASTSRSFATGSEASTFRLEDDWAHLPLNAREFVRRASGD